MDVKLKEFIKTVDEIRSEIATAYDVFEKKCHPIMDRKLPIPAAIRKKSMELLHEYEFEESDRNITETITVFKYEKQIRRAVMHMLADQDPKDDDNTNLDSDEDDDDDDDGDDDDGDGDGDADGKDNDFVDGLDFRLDFERDTIEEVTNIVNLYPEAFDKYDPPQVTNIIIPRSVPFIPSLLSLWMKHCNRKVDKEDCHDAYGCVWYRLNHPSFVGHDEDNYSVYMTEIFERCLYFSGKDKKRFNDEQCALVLQWFINEGIVVGSTNYAEGGNLINELLNFNDSLGSCIERRLQVLVNFCPALLEFRNEDNPLLNAAEYSRIGQYECFISVLMAGIHKLTKNNGILLLFRINLAQSPIITPFARFINRWPDKKEEKQKRLDAVNTALNDPILCHHTPYDTAKAIFEAATSDWISLDGVFFFLRREPDVLQKLMLRGNDTKNDNRTTKHTPKRNSTAAPNSSTNAGLISTKKTKTK